MMLRGLIAALATISALPAASQMSCGDGTGTVSQQDYICAAEETYAALDALNAATERFLASLDPTAKGVVWPAFQAAQDIWLRSAEQTCRAEALLYAGGTDAPAIKVRCFTALTRDRAAYFVALTNRPKG